VIDIVKIEVIILLQRPQNLLYRCRDLKSKPWVDDHLTTIDMNINGNKKDNHKAKEEKGMNKNGNGTCLEIDKFHHPAFAW
jgi:hypothetical protein